MRRTLSLVVGALLVSTTIGTAFAETSIGKPPLLPKVKAAEHAIGKAPSTIDYSCVATAVTARDEALSKALQTVATALQTRGQALSAAWSKTDVTARKTAVLAAWTAFNGSWKTFHDANVSAWQQYKTTTRTTCHLPESANESPDSNSGGL